MITSPISRPITSRIASAIAGARVGGASNPLVWHAATPDSDGVMQAQLIGSGTPTFNVDAGLLLPDFEGIYRTTAEDTPPWHGARKVTNLLRYSEDFSKTSVWTPGTVTYDAVEGAYKVTKGGGVWSDINQYPVANNLGVAGDVTTFSVEIKSATGSAGTCRLYNSSSDSTSGIVVPTEWTRVSNTETLTAVGAVSIRNSTVDFYIRSAQLEVVTGQANQNPSEYVPTGATAASEYFSYENGNTVSSNVVTEAQGATLDPLPSLYGAPSYTNSLTYSNDLTNGAWTVSGGTPVVALSQAGLTGAPNTATLLTDDDGTVTERLGRTVTIPNDSNPCTGRIFILKDSDETRFPAITWRVTGGTQVRRDIHINTKTGATAVWAGFSDGSSEVNDRGLWWEVLFSVTNNSTNSSMNVDIKPAAGSVLGTESAAATGSIIVGNAELHLNKTIAAVRGSAPIITAASTVTTTAISMSYDIANHSDEKGAYYCEATQFDVSATYTVGLVGVGASGRIISETYAGVMTSYDGTGGVTTLGSGTAVAGTSYKYGVAYSTADSAKIGYKDGTAGSEGAYDGEYSATAGLLVWSASGFNGAPTRPGLIKNIRRYNLNYTAAKAKIDELML